MATATCSECGLRMSVTSERPDSTTGRVVATFSCGRCGHSFEDYKDKYEDGQHTLGTPCPECGSGVRLTGQRDVAGGRVLGQFTCGTCDHTFEDYVDNYDGISPTED